MSTPPIETLGEYPVAEAPILAQATPGEPEKNRPTPRDYDKNFGDCIDKKPRNPESPRQKRENENHG